MNSAYLSSLSFMSSSTRIWMVADLGCLGCAFKNGKYSSPFIMRSCRTSCMRRRILSVRQNCFSQLNRKHRFLQASAAESILAVADNTRAPQTNIGRERPRKISGRLKAEKPGSLPPDLRVLRAGSFAGAVAAIR